MTNKEKDKLMEELFGKRTRLDISETKDILNDENEALKRMIEINEKSLRDLKEVTNQKTIDKIEEEVAKDFNLSKFKKDLEKDYNIDSSIERNIISVKESSDIFDSINKDLKDIIIGQDEAIDNLVMAFRRPYLEAFNGDKIRSTIIVEGHSGSGRHLLIKEMSKLLKKYDLVKVEGISTIDLERYRSQSQETLFLQDLYVALNDQKPIIVIENSNVAYPVFARMIAELSINGNLKMNKRYVFSKNQLVSAGEGLNRGVIDNLAGNNKILVFIIEDKASKLSNVYGKSFMDEVDDIIAMGSLNKNEVLEISDKLIESFKIRCQNQVEINIEVDDDFKNYIVSLYNEDEGINSLEKTLNKIYDEVVNLALKYSDIEVINLSYKDNLKAKYKEEVIDIDIEGNNSNERQEIQKELDEIVGLDKVKEYLLSLEDHIKVSKLRAAKGLKSAEVSKHMIFTGNPGTGKTTIARLISRLMKVSGILSQGQLVEVTRADLVAKYVGQTAPQTMEVIKSALGGVLFIDEAYALYRGKDDSFGLEAIDTLVKAMEDYRDDFIVILAGYSKEMSTFLEANSGLKSRFANIIHFEDYTADELVAISKSIAKGKDYRINDEAISSLRIYFEEVQSRKDATSGNGRLARNMVEEAILNQSSRILNDDKAEIDLLLKEDFVFGE